MVKNEKELLEAIKHEHHITKEITDTLIELDQLPSTGTQVYLNDLLKIILCRVFSIKLSVGVPLNQVPLTFFVTDLYEKTNIYAHTANIQN